MASGLPPGLTLRTAYPSICLGLSMSRTLKTTACARFLLLELSPLSRVAAHAAGRTVWALSPGSSSPYTSRLIQWGRWAMSWKKMAAKFASSCCPVGLWPPWRAKAIRGLPIMQTVWTPYSTTPPLPLGIPAACCMSQTCTTIASVESRCRRPPSVH